VIEFADSIRTRTNVRKRNVKIPGLGVRLMDDDPVTIARALRERSTLGRREAKQAKLEAAMRA
jgi:hypothetical protein